MTQLRFTKWQDDLTSFDEITKMAGIIQPGAYRGFDIFNPTTGLNGIIKHTTTGIIRALMGNPPTPSAQTGIWMTNQGCVVMEDADIPITLESNAGNASIRIDAVIGTHYHDDLVAGGVAAAYSIIKGPINNPTPATVTNPQTQVIIGYITIPANATVSSNVTYKRVKVKGLGNKDNALIDELNSFIEEQQFYQGDDTQIIVNTTFSKPTRGTITSLVKGNTYKLQGIASNGNILDLIINKQKGTQMTMVATVDMVIRDYQSNLDGTGKPLGWDQGFRPIKTGLAPDPANPLNDVKLTLPAGTAMEFVRFTDGTTYGEYWKLVSTSYVTSEFNTVAQQVLTNTSDIADLTDRVDALAALINSFTQPGTVRSAYVDVSKVDQTTGLGKDEWVGWAWCNGQYHTTPSGTFFAPDSRGRGAKFWDPAVADYNIPGKVGGVDNVQLSMEQMPKHKHGFDLNAMNFDNAGFTGGDLGIAGSSVIGFNTKLTGGTALGSEGSCSPHENRSRFMVFIAFIKLPA